MGSEKERRDFLKKAALASVTGAGAAAGLTATEALADVRTMKINTDAKAVLADGKVRTRGELMTQMGLNPSTSPDAWLNILICGINAGALTTAERNVLTQRGLKFKGNELLQTKAIPQRR